MNILHRQTISESCSGRNHDDWEKSSAQNFGAIVQPESQALGCTALLCICASYWLNGASVGNVGGGARYIQCTCKTAARRKPNAFVKTKPP